jgi:hypothetical protein
VEKFDCHLQEVIRKKTVEIIYDIAGPNAPVQTLKLDLKKAEGRIERVQMEFLRLQF